MLKWLVGGTFAKEEAMAYFAIVCELTSEEYDRALADKRRDCIQLHNRKIKVYSYLNADSKCWSGIQRALEKSSLEIVNFPLVFVRRFAPRAA